jgi:transcriptional regulator with XRE-family HTH domain
MAARPKHRRLLGEAIRSKRKEIGLSQESLAERSELSTVFISRVECGKESPTVDSLVKIANGLGVKTRELIRDF